MKASTGQTGRGFNLFDVSVPAGFATPPHIHYAEDVALYVLEGSLSLFWGGEKLKGMAGSFFFQPRGTPHGFRVEGEAPARVLYLTVPGGVDQIVREFLPSADPSELMTTLARNKIEILGPLPDALQSTAGTSSKWRNE